MPRHSAYSIQAPCAVVMVRPHHFTVNTETAADNHFQTSQDMREDLSSVAYGEITEAADTLGRHGVEVHLFEDTGRHTPDSVFPNNWFSTHAGGHVAIYPMKAVSRRRERRSDVIEMLKARYRVQEVIDYSGLEPDGLFLEGTGAMVLDHIDRVAYAVRSDRTDPIALERFSTHFNYEPMVFDARDENGVSVYHTNVLMCIATDFAVDVRIALAERCWIARVQSSSIVVFGAGTMSSRPWHLEPTSSARAAGLFRAGTRPLARRAVCASALGGLGVAWRAFLQIDQSLGGELVSHQHTYDPKSQRACDSGRLFQAASQSNDTIDPRKILKRDADNTLVQRRPHRFAVFVEETERDVADGTCIREISKLPRRKDVARPCEKFRGFDCSDAYNCKRDTAKQVHRLSDKWIGLHEELGLSRGGHSLHRKKFGLRTGQPRKPCSKLGRVGLDRRIAHAAEGLNDVLRLRALLRVDVFHHLEDGLTPTRNPDDLSGGKRDLQEMSCRFADPGHDGSVTVFRTLHNNCLGQAVPLTEARLEFAVGASRRDDARPDDILRLSALQHPGDCCLRQPKMLCDLRLSPSLDVIHLGDS
ncbi:hypothetical protein J2W42_003254 [Rhizobium tibeticum]|nr:hypothetical protein [Rhizobium tibeticum]